VVLRIDRDAADGADDPVARQCPRPAWVNLEFGHGLRVHRAERQKRQGAKRDARKHHAADNPYHPILPVEIMKGFWLGPFVIKRSPGGAAAKPGAH
jgi:hypothetical protein